MTTFGLVLIVVSLGVVILFFWRNMALQDERDAALATMELLRSELSKADNIIERWVQYAEQLKAKQGGAR